MVAPLDLVEFDRLTPCDMTLLVQDFDRTFGICQIRVGRESPDMILGDKPLIFEVVLSQVLHRSARTTAIALTPSRAAQRKGKGASALGFGGEKQIASFVRAEKPRDRQIQMSG
jgi:hypothetical protein